MIKTRIFYLTISSFTITPVHLNWIKLAVELRQKCPLSSMRDSIADFRWKKSSWFERIRARQQGGSDAGTGYERTSGHFGFVHLDFILLISHPLSRRICLIPFGSCVPRAACTCSIPVIAVRATYRQRTPAQFQIRN